jgi:hypothetical protein
MVTVSFDPSSMLKLLGGLAIAALAFLLLRGGWRLIRRLFSPALHGLDRKGIQDRWAEIERLVRDGSEMQLKIAVMESDKLLDHALKAMAMPGTTLGERLKFAAYKYPRINDVWWAHRLRNQLVHESSFYLEPAMARKAIVQYKKTLQMLNLL